jgi:hypothetical protein
MQAWAFSGQPSSGPPSYWPTAPRPSDPARPRMGRVRLVIYTRSRSPISRVPFALNLLSRKGSLGCSLRCVHEASDYPQFRCHSRRKEEAGYWRGSTVCTIGAIGRRWDREIAAEKPRPSKSGNGHRTGYPPRIEQCVCVWGGLTIGYEAHGIGGQIRKTRAGIEGSGNARRRRAEEPLAQPIRHEASSEDSPLSADRGGCPPNAGECTGRAQIFGSPPSNAGRQQPSDPTTLIALPEPTS